MASLDRFQLDYIKGNALASEQTKDLLQEKQEALKSLQNSRSTSHYQPQPKLTPSNDIRIDSASKSKGLDQEAYNQKFNEVNDSYNEKITQSTKEHFKQNNHPNDIELLEQFGKEDLALLLEEDAQAVLNKQHEELTKEAISKEDKELEPEKDEFDISMDEDQSKDIFNEPDGYKGWQLYEEWELEQEMGADQEIFMDDAKSEEIFRDSSDMDDFNDNSKDIDLDKDTTSPADDYE